MPRNIAASKIGNGVISLLWQLRCHCIPDHDKFSSLSNKIFQMFVYGDAVMLRIGRYWPRKTVSVSNHLHMPVRPMPFCIVWPLFLFDCTFRKHLGNFWEFFGQMVYRPPPLAKNFPYAYELNRPFHGFCRHLGRGQTRQNSRLDIVKFSVQ